MEYRIKDLHDAAVRNLKCIGKYKPFEKGLMRNERIMASLFKKTLNGEIKGFYLKDHESFKAYHRSTKEDNTIQYSYGFFKNGELVPCGDVQMHEAKDLIREGFSSGIYAEIA